MPLNLRILSALLDLRTLRVSGVYGRGVEFSGEYGNTWVFGTLVLRYPWIFGFYWHIWIFGLFGFCWHPWIFGESPSLPHLLLHLGRVFFPRMFAAGHMVLRLFLVSHGTLVAVSATLVMMMMMMSFICSYRNKIGAELHLCVTGTFPTVYWTYKDINGTYDI